MDGVVIAVIVLVVVLVLILICGIIAFALCRNSTPKPVEKSSSSTSLPKNQTSGKPQKELMPPYPSENRRARSNQSLANTQAAPSQKVQQQQPQTVAPVHQQPQTVAPVQQQPQTVTYVQQQPVQPVVVQPMVQPVYQPVYPAPYYNSYNDESQLLGTIMMADMLSHHHHGFHHHHYDYC